MYLTHPLGVVDCYHDPQGIKLVVGCIQVVKWTENIEQNFKEFVEQYYISDQIIYYEIQVIVY